jgi:VanZ family protein
MGGNGILNMIMLKVSLRLLNAYGPPIVWAVFIYILSAQSALPSFTVSTYDFIFKKCSHIFVYGVLYFLVYRGINLGKTTLKQKNWLLPYFICFLYAAADELHQIFTPHRTPTFRDVGYDMLGVSIFFLRIYHYI